MNTDYEQLVDAACRTVHDVAVHFAELRTRTLRMADEFRAGEKGYFTPTQDEQVRHVLIAYWRARLAMLELIEQMQRIEPTLEGEKRSRVFLIAYAAAIVLVDAARFMRDTFKDRPVAIRKLNEAEPCFGIPANVYDTVQKSLTDPVNAWHLYHANATFDEYHDELSTLSKSDARLGPLWDIIERLGDRVRVSPADYARARVYVRGRELAERLGRMPLGRLLYQLQMLGGCLAAELRTAPLHQARLPHPVRRKLRQLAQPGDVFIVRKEYALTNYFLPGYWPHAALHLGRVDQLQQMGLHTHENVKTRWRKLCDLCDGNEHRVLEAMKDGVLFRSIESPFASDAITMIRPRIDPSLLPAALARGVFHEGKSYDFDFDFTRSDRLVCTEVVYRTYEGVGGMCFALSSRAGRLTLAAEDMLHMAVRSECFDVVAVYAPSYRKRLQLGADAVPALSATL